MTKNEYPENVKKALRFAYSFGQCDGAYHKTWVIDQMVRALLNCPEKEVTKKTRNQEYTYTTQGESEDYLEFIKTYENSDEEGFAEYIWETGNPP